MRSRNARSLFAAAALTSLLLLALGSGTAAAEELHPLSVTATTSIACDWSITKTGPAELTLAVNEGFDVPYTVTVTKTCTNHVHGTVSGAGNPTSVSVKLSDNGANTSATVSGCTSNGQTFSCNYDGHPASTAAGTVTATATYADGSTASGTTPYSFANVTPTEDSVDVFDSQLSSPLAIHLGHSATFRYTVHVSFSECGDHTLTNTATVVDDRLLDTAVATVTVHVPCAGGCTLTQGYWKTHSKYGPAPSDATWNLLAPSGPDSPFFLSGQTWYQVFKTSPAGNAYYILAHQYMAARLNILAGASTTPAVTAALAWATTFFSTYTPAQIAALKGSSSLRQNAIANASILESFNTGAIGPGHCDE